MVHLRPATSQPPTPRQDTLAWRRHRITCARPTGAERVDCDVKPEGRAHGISETSRRTARSLRQVYGLPRLFRSAGRPDRTDPAPLAPWMTIRRPAGIWSLIAEQSASHGGPVSAADACTAAVAAVAATGGWLSAGQGPQPGHLVHATDGVSERLSELQLTLGEGPVPDVYATGAPVLASDLGDTDIDRRWPVFAQAARGAGAAALFAFPLQIGAIRSGVLGLYRAQAAPLSALQFGDALIFADTATLLLLGTQHHAANGVPASPGPGGSRRHWPWATPRSTRPPACSPSSSASAITDAYLRLRAYAFVNDLRLTDVARDIVARRLRLRPDPDTAQDGGKA